MRTYAKALLEYTDQSINYLPFHAEENAKRVTVRTEIAQPGGVNIPINYSMFLNQEGKWKVYDISVDGVSCDQLSYILCQRDPPGRYRQTACAPGGDEYR